MPGPRPPSAAISPATPITTMAWAAARARSGVTAANAPHRAEAVQPRPVTRVIMGWPLRTWYRAPPPTM